MKIRLIGPAGDVAGTVDALRLACTVDTVSAAYLTRSGPPGDVRVYVDARPLVATRARPGRVDLGDGLHVELTEEVPGRPVVLVEQWLPDPDGPASTDPDVVLVLSPVRAVALANTLINLTGGA